MSDTIQNSKSIKLEKAIAILYVYLLPVRMIGQLSFLTDILRGAAFYFDVVLLTLGIVLYLIRTHGRIYTGREENSKLLQYLGCMILYFNLSSVVMACVMQAIYGNHGTESAFSGIAGMLIYFTQYFLMFWYNREVFKLITKDELTKILHRMCILMLILGWWQFFIMNFGGAFAAVYDAFNIFDVLHPSNMPKLCLTGSEGASAGTLISALVLPFLYSQILTKDKTLKYFIEIVLWLPVLYMTRSSTAYILFAICSLSALLMFFIKNRNGIGAIVLSVLLLFIFALILYPDLTTDILPKEIGGQIKYLLLEKIQDEKSGSTIARMVPLVINWGAFTEFPLLGVGNGLQGYFFEKYFPSWAVNKQGSDVMEFYRRSKHGISNGALFFPSLLSGYGIVGIAVLIGYVFKSASYMKKHKEEFGSYYYYYYIAAIAIFITGFQGDFCGKFFIWFILSIPFMNVFENKTQ